MDKENCIILEKVNKCFSKKTVLKDVDLNIPYGCIYGLLGPSGCGKTTIVKIMSGILEATSGSTYVLGEKMPKLSLMRKIGYMAQSDALYGTLSAAENLKFFGAIYGMDKIQIKKRTEEVMSLVNLTDDLKKQVAAYSGGMKRRLSLALAILHNPPVLILDEPTVGIDPLLRKDIWEELNKMVLNGVTILVTTHVMDEAARCHQLAMIREGVVLSTGTPGELEERSGKNNLEEAFLYYGGARDEN